MILPLYEYFTPVFFMKKPINAEKYYSTEAKRALSGPKGQRGGPRPGSGRPSKLDKAQWGQITCVLKKETIEALKVGADSKHFGEFLQFHLDRYPPPSREIYLALINREPITMKVKGQRRQVLMSSGSYGSNRIRKRPIHRRPLTNKEFEDAIVAAG